MENLLPTALAKRIRRRQCVAFVGAGFSMACGMPDWGNLLEQIQNDAYELFGKEDENLKTSASAVKGKNYTMAADILRGQMNSGDFHESIRERFSLNVWKHASNARKAQMEHRMENLVKAPWAGIATTNYDELIEYALGHWTQNEVVRSSGDGSRLGYILSTAKTAQMFFVKIHGSISDSNIVLGTEEYDRTYISKPQMTAFLTALMLRYHLVFIGCSLEDEILRLRRKLSHDFEKQIPSAYALLPDSRHNVQRASWLKDFTQIYSIFYENTDNTHSAVDRFLEECAKCADPQVDSRVGSTTMKDLRSIEGIDRIKRIGTLNVELLTLIHTQPNHSIRHFDLLNIGNIEDMDISSELLDMSPDERFYRILFLTSINLLAEDVEADGLPRYTLTPEGIEAIAPNTYSSSRSKRSTKRG
jgi:NAD-dependent SIR2 family protein deacetylase